MLFRSLSFLEVANLEDLIFQFLKNVAKPVEQLYLLLLLLLLHHIVFQPMLLGLLNFFVKPILVLFTLPITFLTLGLFLLVINAIIILLCDHFIEGFSVSSFWTAMLFSIILSLSQSLVFQITGEAKK